MIIDLKTLEHQELLHKPGNNADKGDVITLLIKTLLSGN